jgi:hypothetical protein
MASTKMTFSLDQRTVARLNEAAERLQKPKSQVVREAIEDYAERVGRLSETERRQLLKIFDEVVPAIGPRPLAEVEEEIAEVRRARRGGGRSRPLQ